MGHRGGVQGSLSGNEGSEHEGSRRMKTELLVQMDGLLGNSSNIFVLAASNLPWDLDPAFLRRLEKRINIGLPTKDGRKEMIRSHLSEFAPVFKSDVFYDNCADQTSGFSGSDIRVLCKEVAMKPLRRMLEEIECTSATSIGAPEQNLSLLVKRNPVTEQDFKDALRTTNHTTDKELCSRHSLWNASHGSN